MKTCSKCKTKKDFTEFSKDKSKKDGLCYCCKACVKEYDDGRKDESKQYYEANRERYLAGMKQRYQDNREHRLAYAHQYRLINREYLQAYEKQRYVDNPDSGRMLRAKSYGAEIGYLPGNIKESLKAWYGPTCMADGCNETNVTVDHVIPLSKGGQHALGNLQLLCGSHNSAKRDKSTDYRKTIWLMRTVGAA